MNATLSLEGFDNLSLLADFSQEERTAFLSNGKIISFKAKQFIFHHGDPVSHFYIVLKGIVQIFRITPDGHKLTSDLLNPGEGFPISSPAAMGKSYRSNAMAARDCVLLQIKTSWLQQNMANFDDLQGKLLRSATERLFMAQVQAEHQATMKAPQLVACLLQQMCVLYHLDPERFELPFSKSILASRLGIELETFSRALPKLKKYGIVVDGNMVGIRDPLAARSFVCSQCSVAEDCASRRVLDRHAKDVSGKDAPQ